MLTVLLFLSSTALFAWVLGSLVRIQAEYVYYESEARSDGELTYVSHRIFPYLTAILFLDQFTFLTILVPSQPGTLRKLKYACGMLWLPSVLIHVLYWFVNGMFA